MLSKNMRTHHEDEGLITGIRAASPAASVRSDQSMDPPRSFKFGEPYTSLMMRDHLRCSVCKDVLKEPVSTPCGHSFCRTCILSYWTQPGSYSCPQCTRQFKILPALYPNLALANVVQTLKQDLFRPDLLGSEDVTSDIYAGEKNRAMKSSYDSACETGTRKQPYTPQEPIAKPGRLFQGQASSERNELPDYTSYQGIWEKTKDGKGLQLQSQRNKVLPFIAVEPFFNELEEYQAMLLSQDKLAN